MKTKSKKIVIISAALVVVVAAVLCFIYRDYFTYSVAANAILDAYNKSEAKYSKNEIRQDEVGLKSFWIFARTVDSDGNMFLETQITGYEDVDVSENTFVLSKQQYDAIGTIFENDATDIPDTFYLVAVHDGSILFLTNRDHGIIYSSGIFEPEKFDVPDLNEIERFEILVPHWYVAHYSDK